MRNPLSLHSGLGSLLFLSLIPVALSLPVGGGNGFQNDGFQNDGFQNDGFQNHDFQNHNLYQWSPSNLQSVVTQQGPNVPQHGLPQQHLSSFGNAPQLTHVPQQQLPQHQLPQQHLSSFGNAPQPAQNAPKFSSTSRILSADEWDRLFLDSISRDLGRGESEIPPSLPSSHAGSYPSSSEARGFDRSRILPDDEWNRFVLDSSRQDLVRGKSAIPPSLPSSHAGSYPSSSEARGFDRSRILPDDEWNRFVLGSARQDLVRGKSAIPPSLPSSHAGSYPSSSEARGFDRVSNEGASSSGTSYIPSKSYQARTRKPFKAAEEVKRYAHIMQRSRNEPDALRDFPYSASPINLGLPSKEAEAQRTIFRPVKDGTIFKNINENIFGGQLKKVELSNFPVHTLDNYRRATHKPSRKLPLVDFSPRKLKNDGGVIKSVRMTVHKGPFYSRQKISAPEEDPEAFVRRQLKDKTFYNFWGIPEGRSERSQKTIVHYGMGYLDPSDFEAVNNHLKAVTLKAETAARFH
ncbi:hypothetical protein NDA18_002705 [Ustilago nuda]|nr:hypothetical protein NDA18_002705 [Ustilago nuda]